MKLFISYSRDDAGNFARHIHRYLRDKGHDVFIDVNDIRIGTPWASSIEKNISECDIFVVILTPDSITSSYVEREVLQAQRENKMIVPCRHEYVDYNDIKWELDKIQGIKFVDEYQLVLNLHHKIKNYKNVQNEKPYSITNISENVDALIEKGVALLQQGKYQEALECYDKVLRVDPNHVYALHGKGGISFIQGKYQEAIEWYDKALRVNPNEVNVLYNKGDVFYKQGEYQEAIEWYDKALRVNPNEVIALHGKGSALLQQGKYQDATEWLDKALRIEPNNVDSLSKNILALLQQGKYQDATEWLDKALRIEPNEVSLLYSKGKIFFIQGKYQEAIEWYDKALRVDPNFTGAQNEKKVHVNVYPKKNLLPVMIIHQKGLCQRVGSHLLPSIPNKI